MSDNHNIQYILFDAANTLIHKPSLWGKMQEVISVFGKRVGIEELMIKHKLISEIINFPDRTSESFYRSFNAELLLSLGIVPTSKLLDSLFKECKCLPWEKFSDTVVLQDLPVKMGILSNFHKDLPVFIRSLFGATFSELIDSESLGVRKPNQEFFKHAILKIGIPADEILYIGDSIKLDIIPAQNLGMKVLLIDRLGVYKTCDFSIDSLYRLENLSNLTTAVDIR